VTPGRTEVLVDRRPTGGRRVLSRLVSAPRVGRRQLYAAQTRAAIVDAARELFVRRGYEATSISDIGAAAETGKGTVYHHFADKQEIFAEIFTATQSAVMHSALEAMAGDGSPWVRLEGATRRFLRSYVADPAAAAILRQASGVLGRDRVREIDEATALPLVRAGLAQFVADGEVRPLNVDVVAQLIITIYCESVLVIAAAEEPERLAGDAEAAVLALLDGLRAGAR
jgi:AcrR family transcriptional regulator